METGAVPVSPLVDARRALKVNLIILRAKRGLSQVDLARHAGVSRTVVSDLEQGRGDARLATLARIASALETTIAELLEPWRPATVSEEELVHRARLSDDRFIDADALFAALGEADGVQRYSRRGRPPRLTAERARR